MKNQTSPNLRARDTISVSGGQQQALYDQALENKNFECTAIRSSDLIHDLILAWRIRWYFHLTRDRISRQDNMGQELGARELVLRPCVTSTHGRRSNSDPTRMSRSSAKRALVSITSTRSQLQQDRALGQHSEKRTDRASVIFSFPPTLPAMWGTARRARHATIGWIASGGKGFAKDRKIGSHSTNQRIRARSSSNPEN